MTKQQLIAKYGKKFAAATATEGVLQGVHYASDGSAFVTNRHYALRVRGAHNYPQALTLHAKDGSPLDGEYPQNYNKVFPQRYDDAILLRMGVELDAALLAAQTAAAVAELRDKKHPVCKLEVTCGVASLVIARELITLRAFLGNVADAKSKSVRSFNATYLLTALQVFKDYEHDVQIQLGRPLDPILLTGGDVDVVIMPIRATE